VRPGEGVGATSKGPGVGEEADDLQLFRRVVLETEPMPGRNWRGEEKEEDDRGVLVFSRFDPRWHELVQVDWVPHKQKLTRWRAT
jgi:hypothetical protein